MPLTRVNTKNLLSRTVTRDLPLFMVSASYGTYLGRKTGLGLGFQLSKNYVLMDHGTAIVHRDNSEWYEQLPARLKKALNDKKRYAYITRSINKTAAATRYLEFFLACPPSETSTGSLEKLHDTIKDGVPGMIFAHWIPIFSELKLADFGIEKTASLNKSRKQIEKFFSLAADSAYLMLESLGKAYGIVPATLKYATYMELIELIELGETDVARIENRKNNPHLFVEDKIFTGEEEIERFLEREGYVFERPEKTSADMLAGITARGGLVRGRTQVIMSRDDFDKFQDGSILVAPMTSPEYTPLIHKASGIITDEGGLLSHAAIICRELNKPCIVGTKFATDLLSNAHHVVLNADEGRVTVLRREI